MTDTRPPIPRAIRRAVLLEAGHRCSIHTCRYTSVEIHHIIPWEQCREHKFENLIALCPNCHERAGRGEIDRKSLILYKARLAILFDADLGLSSVKSPEKSCELSDDIDETYRIQAEFPEFESNSAAVTEVNALLRAHAVSFVQSCRKSAERGGEFSPVLSEQQLLNLRESGFEVFSFDFLLYEVVHFGNGIISIRHIYQTYRAGALHPNRAAGTLNFHLNPTYQFDLEDLSPSLNDLVTTLSEICIVELKKQIAQNTDASIEESENLYDEWISRGAGPKLSNFRDFSVTPQSLVITFSPYAVAPYAFGFIHVKIPWEVLSLKVMLTEPFKSFSNSHKQGRKQKYQNDL